MNNKFLNHSINPARWLILVVGLNLAILLLAPRAQAAIAIQDGTPLAALASSGGGPTVTKAFTVTPGASVLVVILEDRQNAVIIPEPATITWNGNTLTQDTNSLANTSNYRSMAMYHLYNPPAGSGNISATYSTGNNTIVMTAYTLNGVDTTAAPIILQTNNLATTTLYGTANGVVAGSWAAVGSIWGNTTALTGTGGTGGTATTVASTALGGSSINAGYVANLSAGSVTIGVTNGGSTKGCFIAEIFSPGAIVNTPPTITTQPSWLPATNYAVLNPTTKATVFAIGTAPLSYQWFTNSTAFPLSDSANHLIGSISNILTISNAIVSDSQNYIIVITNLYGSVTSSVAPLTVLPVQLATNFTLNFGGTAIQQANGNDWNTVNQWNPSGLSAANAMTAFPGSSFEVVVGSRLRNPAGTTYNVFPGASLSVDGNGGMENGTVNAIGEIRFKNSAFSVTTNYYNNLVLNGGQLNIGDSTDVVLQGKLTVAANSTLQTLAPTGTNQTYRVDSYLTGSGTIQLYLSNSNTAVSLPSASLNIAGNTNTFTGKWNIVQGPLVGSGANSLGTNTITIGTNAALETAYDINNTNSSLILNGQFFLHQNDTFQSVVVGGVPLVRGTYTFAQLNSSYPPNFPATWTQLSGSAVNTGSGSITVLRGPSVIALTSSAQTNGYLGAVTFTAAVQTNGVTAADATGTVIFSTASGPISTNSVSAGSASSASVNNLPRGTNIITVIYSGDSSYFGTTNTLSQVVTNHPPVAQTITIGSQSGTLVTLQIIGGKFAPTDVDGDVLLVSAIQNPSTQGGVVTTDGTNITFIAAGNFTGADTFNYSVSDGFSGLVTNTITATVVANGEGFNLLSGPADNHDGTATIKYLGIPRYHYALETTPSLTLPIAWTPVITNTASTNGRLSFTFDASAGQGYFRTRYVP